MKLLIDSLDYNQLQRQFELWLDTIVYQDVWEEIFVTNRTIINSGEYPEGWINPFTLTVEELDKMRETFAGGFKKWSQFVKDNIPFLDSKEEGKLKREVNKKRDMRLCGTRCRVRINPLTRQVYHEVWHCKRRECPRCTARKEKNLLERMKKLVGNSYTIVTPQEAETLVEVHSSNSILRIPIDKDHIMVINDKGIGEAFTEQLARQYAKVPPAGMNISGKLGKNSGVLVEEDDPFEKRVEVSVAEFVVDTTQEQMLAIQEEYDKETKDIQADEMEDLQKAVYQCENVLQRIIKDKGIGIFFLYRTKFIIKEKEFERHKESNAPTRQGIPT